MVKLAARNRKIDIEDTVKVEKKRLQKMKTSKMPISYHFLL